jgi:hypothetical protein
MKGVEVSFPSGENDAEQHQVRLVPAPLTLTILVTDDIPKTFCNQSCQ